MGVNYYILRQSKRRGRGGFYICLLYKYIYLCSLTGDAVIFAKSPLTNITACVTFQTAYFSDSRVEEYACRWTKPGKHLTT